MRLTLLVLSLISSTALAQQETPPSDTTNETEEEARARFRAGSSLVQTGDLISARAEFRRGFELSRRPLFLFNMAECSRELGQADRARREYAEYLWRDEYGARADEARARLEELGPGDRSTPDFIVELEAPSAPTPRETATAVLVIEPDEANALEERRWYADWPFWTAVGVVIVGAVVTTSILATRDSGPECAGSCQQFSWPGDLLP